VTTSPGSTIDYAEPTHGFLPSLPGRARAALGGPPAAGDRVGDFHLLAELGKGSFARVFLARQVSLGRHVALKVSANTGQEARTLASLDHPHIVQVFDETVDRERDVRLLYMRYVPGATLRDVLAAVAEVPFARRTGRLLLETVAARAPSAPCGTAPEEDSPLADYDAVEAVCWLGARLADALAFAHARGVLHRDLKPANVLLDRWGRPLLLDFNLAFDPRRGAGIGESFGGTPPYMAPEHRDAFEGLAAPEVVDERSDVYALGIILFELLTGTLPAAEERRAGAPAPARLEPAVPAVLDRAVRRCLEPDPARRYQSAAELARALDGCRQWQRSQRELPRAGPLVRAAGRYPVLLAVALPSLPHVAGAALAVTYNALWLAAHPEAARWAPLFAALSLGYTAAALLFTCRAAWRLGGPLWRTWRSPEGADADADTLAGRRAGALGIPRLALGLSCLGWLPGVVLVPATLAVLAGPRVALHLLPSYAVAALIALVYCVYAALFLTLRVGYPSMWGDARGMWPTARVELAKVGRLLGALQVLAGLIPLAAGAALLAGRIGAGPDQPVTPWARVFPAVLLTLIVLGMIGSGLTVLIHARLQRTLAALTGSGPSAG
jgi:hypothetical protein